MWENATNKHDMFVLCVEQVGKDASGYLRNKLLTFTHFLVVFVFKGEVL